MGGGQWWIISRYLLSFVSSVHIQTNVWWHYASLLVYIPMIAHTFHQIIQYIHSSPFAEVPLHLLIASKLRLKNLTEPGLPFQQAVALTELLRTLTELHHILTELSRTLEATLHLLYILKKGIYCTLCP